MIITLMLPAITGCGGPAPADTARGAQRDVHVPTFSAASRRDLQAAESLRRALLADETLSVDARNIDVCARGGIMTLRGGVASEEERRQIDAIAGELSGVSQVNDQMEVLDSAGVVSADQAVRGKL